MTKSGNISNTETECILNEIYNKCHSSRGLTSHGEWLMSILSQVTSGKPPTLSTEKHGGLDLCGLDWWVDWEGPDDMDFDGADQEKDWEDLNIYYLSEEELDEASFKSANRAWDIIDKAIAPSHMKLG